MNAPAAGPDKDPYWWTPWAVLAAILVFGLLGFLGALSPKRGGLTAADVPVTPPPPTVAPSASAKH
jgi:hypothetical protein